MTKKLLIILLFLASNVIFSQVVINELDSDTPSTDDKEFIELKSTVPNFSLNGYVLVLFNGGSTGTSNLSYYAIDLDGLTTDANGIIVLGNTLVSPVPTYIFSNNVVQNGPDAVAIYQANGSDFPMNTPASTTNLIDALVYGNNNTQATALLSALGVSTQINENMNSQGTVQSIQRKADGTYEVKAPTPGANNDGSGIVFNGITITAPTTHLNEGESFVITFTTQTNVASNLTFNFSLHNDSFTTADYTGNTTVLIPAGSNSFSTTIQIIDDAIDEGDEVLKIKFGTLPAGYVRMNDNIEIRVIDNDFTVSAWGTPLNPTHGVVTSTAPAGYYSSLEGLSGAALKQAVQNIIANPAVVRAHNYGDIVEILKKADQNPLNSNQVWMMYVESPRAKLDYQTGSSNVGTWNREHIYPQSRGGFSNGTSSTPDGINVWLPTNADDINAAHADAHHLRAEDGPENSSRNNRDYGGTDYNGPVGTQGSWKGDVARAVFYMAVRYNALDVVNGNPPDTTVGQLGDLASLLAWNHSDPSDDFEMNRNNYIYTWQVNRNPFIDHPGLADYIWGTHVGEPWSATLSTPDVNALQVLLYPNPANDYLYIDGVQDRGQLEVYTITGQKVKTLDFEGTTKVFLDLSSGMYITKITSDNKTVVKKLLIR
ncbi:MULTISPECIES: endonuclease [unclassified Flavobacterium]|uniref:endonuclease n=1 Tax=unclassified Flavobacterium TaxID=196869 RepID=UPI00095ED4C1|nr:MULTISPECIES: endonuclease [unclassified Flavobacterium]MBN9284178.1 endonuclease [Flavobacterium sp.]OJV70737.1 MAG: ribonuclease [Flavobacterium sp. 40-81]